MDRLTFTCPHCRSKFLAPPSFAGTRSACPACGVVVPVWPAPPPKTSRPVPKAKRLPSPRKAGEAAIGFAAALLIGLGAVGWNWAKMSSLRVPDIDDREAVHRAYQEERDKRQFLMVAGAIVFGIGIGGFVTVVPTLGLKDALASLAPVVGKSTGAAEMVLGPAAEIVNSEEGRVSRLTWKSPMFRFTLEFRDGVCTGLVHAVED